MKDLKITDMIKYEHKKVVGYDTKRFVENGHTMFEFDVLQRLKRLAYLESQIVDKKLLTLSEAKKQFEKVYTCGDCNKYNDCSGCLSKDSKICGVFSKVEEKESKLESIFNDLLNEQEEIISSPKRFNGVSIEKIKQIFAKYGVKYKQPF